MGPLPLVAVEAHLNSPEPLTVPVAVSMTSLNPGPMLDKTLREVLPHPYPTHLDPTIAPSLPEPQLHQCSLDGPAHLLHLLVFHQGDMGLSRPHLEATHPLPGQGFLQLMLHYCQTADDRPSHPLPEGSRSFPMTDPHSHRSLREVTGQLRAMTPPLLPLLSAPNLRLPHHPLHLDPYLVGHHLFHRDDRDLLLYRPSPLEPMITASHVYRRGTVRSTGEVFLWTRGEILSIDILQKIAD